MDVGITAANNLRARLRPQFQQGQATKCGPLGDDWLEAKWPELLDAHYQCQVPGPPACLQDALAFLQEASLN